MSAYEQPVQHFRATCLARCMVLRRWRRGAAERRTRLIPGWSPESVSDSSLAAYISSSRVFSRDKYSSTSSNNTVVVVVGVVVVSTTVILLTS